VACRRRCGEVVRAVGVVRFFTEIYEYAFPRDKSRKREIIADESATQLARDMQSDRRGLSLRVTSTELEEDERTPSEPESTRCGCGSGKRYSRCCMPFHREWRAEESATEVLRARVCAYKYRCIRYLMSSCAPGSEQTRIPPKKWLRELHTFCDEHAVQRLEIVQTQIVGPHTTFIMFRVQTLHEGDIVTFTERAKFVEQRGRWFYDSGKLIDVDTSSS